VRVAFGSAKQWRRRLAARWCEIPPVLHTRRVQAPLVVLGITSIGMFVTFADATIVNIFPSR
jgi:hypothetical protein